MNVRPIALIALCLLNSCAVDDQVSASLSYGPITVHYAPKRSAKEPILPAPVPSEEPGTLTAKAAQALKTLLGN